MGSIIKRRAQVAIKAESIPGQAETLSASEATIRAINPQLSLVGERSRREYVSEYLGRWKSSAGPRMGTLSFDVDLAGSGTEDTAPSWGIIMRAAGFDQTINASTSVVYAPTSTPGTTATTQFPTVTVGYYEGGIRHLLVGCQADFSIRIENGTQAVMSVTLTGKYGGTTDTALLSSVAYESTVAPAVVSASFTIQSYSANIRELVINSGNVIEMDEDISDSTGYSQACIVDRDVTGSLQAQTELVATYDWWTNALTDSHSGALSCTIGSSAGNRVVIAAPAVQYSLPSSGADGGRAVLPVDLFFCRSSGSTGDDELTFTHN